MYCCLQWIVWEIICCGEKLVFYCYDLRSVCRLLEKIALVSEVHLINNGSGGFWIIMKYVLQCACVHTPACMCLTEIAPVGVWGVFVRQRVFLVVDVFVFWSSSFRRYTCEMWLCIHWLHTPDGLYDYECLTSTHSYLLFNVLFFSQQHSVPVFYLRGSGSHDGCGSTQTTVV